MYTRILETVYKQSIILHSDFYGFEVFWIRESLIVGVNFCVGIDDSSLEAPNNLEVLSHVNTFCV